MNKLLNKILRSKNILIILLSIHFLVNLAVYFNTNTFYEISESGSNFEAFYSLIKGDEFLPVYGGFFLTPAFIAYFISSLTGGGLFYYFIFQIILSTLTVFFIYKIILFITQSKEQSIIGIILLIFYLEFDLLGSIFYNQIYEVFFVSLFLFLILNINEESKIKKSLIYSFFTIFTIFISMFFRLTLAYSFLLFIFLLLVSPKNSINIIKFALPAVILIIISFAYNPSKVYNSKKVDYTQLWFWGHTMYGGHGGEASFVFDENEKRFNDRLKQFVNENHIDSVTPDVVNQFRISEIKTFIIKEPHKWLLLQFKKLFYTFGSVPQKDGLIMLYKGKVKIPWMISALLIQFSYTIILIMFLLTADLNIKKIFKDKYKRIIYFLGIYLIGGICIYAAYQERYRPIVFVCFFIPVIALNINRIKTIFSKENRKELVIKLIIILILIVVWFYQAYEALYIYHDRYFKVIQ